MACLLPMSSRLLRPLAKISNPMRPLDIVPSLSWRGFSYDKGNHRSDVLLMDEVTERAFAIIASPDEIKKFRAAGVNRTSLEPRPPDLSHTRAVVPLGADVKTRGNYITANKAIRLGRILEAMDNFAGFCCAKHNRDPDMPANQKIHLLIITVLVDQIDIDTSMPPLSPYKDIFFDGKVTWAGQSSMECTIYLEQELEGKIQRFMKATMVFVARDPITHGAAVIPPLELVTDDDKRLFQDGIKNKGKRIQEATRSVLKIAPTREEALMIHDIFLSSLDQESGILQTRVKPPDSIWMEDTIVKSCIICHPTQRNLFNKIYGGFIMRKAFELAHTTAIVHSKCPHPRCKNIDDMLFQRPVEIGSLLFFSSQIVYNNGSDLQIRVRANQIREGESESQDFTNDCHFTFDCSHVVDKDFAMPQILPKTYAEAMLYVDGKRRYDEVGRVIQPDGM